MSTQALKNDKTIQGLSTYTDSIRFTTDDLTTAGTTQTLTLDIKAGQQVRGVAYKLHTAFSGGSATSVTIDVGDGADADGYIDAEDIFTGGNAYGPDAVDAEAGILGKVYAADDTIDFLFTSDVNVNALTAGDIEIFFNIFDVDSIAGRQTS
jgi:hypothetical protein